MSKSWNMKDSLHLFILPLGPQLLPLEWDKYFLELPIAELTRILKYKHWQDRQRALLGNILVRWMLKKFTNETPINIARNTLGRPYLANNTNWSGDFNLSHSGEWIVAAITNHGHVGVDVEKIEQFNEEIMAYTMSEEEINEINQYAKFDRTKLFYELWTMKEAIYKTGLFPNATPVSINTIEINKKRRDIHTHIFYIDKVHPVTVCWDCGQFPIVRTVLNRDQLVSYL
ncbi:4'-phosphopantetheinyl transferase superfamily protein [Lysinibacillus telephonicus]|uniref:4'-phosphopantetheinyl transferase family protein n=1 Tax=Lysinibacillus telephonicus TaxID=1714840 RepID=UPI0039780A36